MILTTPYTAVDGLLSLNISSQENNLSNPNLNVWITEASVVKRMIWAAAALLVLVLVRGGKQAPAMQPVLSVSWLYNDAAVALQVDSGVHGHID